MDRQKFIDTIAELCSPLSLSVPVSVTIAQAALESAWGESGLTKNGNALFGIKCGSSWTGKRYRAKTSEYVSGQTINITDDFRAYDSWSESIIDHDDFLRRNSRYAAVLECTSGYDAADALQAAGYATDPNYAHKLQSIISQYGLANYDNANTQKKQAQPNTTKTVEIIAQSGDTLNIIVRVISNGQV